MYYSNMDFFDRFMEVFVNLFCRQQYCCLATYKVDSFSYYIHVGSLLN